MANPIITGGVASPQSIYDEYKVTLAGGNQKRAEGYHPVGTRAYLPDGRVFYYASNGATALTTNSLLAIPGTLGLNRHEDHDKIILTASYANFSVGAKNPILHEADVDNGDIIENEYKDGFLHFSDVAPEGQFRKILSHDSFDASGTATSGVIELSDPLKVAAGATSEITLSRNMYDRAIASSTAEEVAAIGINQVAVTASTALATDVTTAAAETDTYFFWCQTWGPTALQVSDTPAAGNSLTPGTSAKMGISSVDASLLMNNIGVSLQSVPDASDFIAVNLMINA